MMPLPRAAIMIDGPNLYASSRACGFDVDYKALLAHFGGRSRVVTARYYTAVRDDDGFSSLRPLIDWLDYNEYRVISKPVKTFTNDDGSQTFKGNMDVEIAVDAMELAPHLDEIILFSGDGDFRSLIEAVQRRGVRVVVISSLNVCADELRRQADEFIDFGSLRSVIGKSPRGERVSLARQSMTA